MSLKTAVRARIPRAMLWRLQPVRLYSWTGDRPVGNFGDHLSAQLVRRLFDVDVVHAELAECELVALGSLLQEVERQVRDRRPIIWGTGFIAEGGEYAGPPIDIRAVRGELTRERVARRARRRPALGDPGILTPLAFPEFVGVPKRHRIGLVPHYVDAEHPAVRRLAARDDVHVIDVIAPVADVLAQIAACEFVISSSLHGAIVAESYGVPNAWVRFGDGVIGGRYKFDDFYSAFGTRREPGDAEAIAADIAAATGAWRPLPDLERVQERLLEAFPAKRR